MEGKVYGYARVSGKDQNLDRQLDAFEAFDSGVRPRRSRPPTLPQRRPTWADISRARRQRAS